MFDFTEIEIRKLVIHCVGNKLRDDKIRFSETQIQKLGDVDKELLLQYFIQPFKDKELYSFFHSSEINLNELFSYSSIIFDTPELFFETSKKIANHLYDCSLHPKIKKGELYVAYFKDCIVDNDKIDAIGIFKSELKENFLKVNEQKNFFDVEFEQGVDIRKLDKGCLIFNIEREQGYKIAIVNQTNHSEAAYWIDDFLKLKIRNDNYTQTNTVLKVYKDFVTKKIDEEFEISKTDKIDLLNRSIKYFKEKEHFDLDEFSNEVLTHEQGIESFKRFKKNYEDEFETEIGDSFLISDTAVKKQARVFKSVLKLDKNFHIYIHGNKELIEKGYDEEMKMSYYKVYFNEEN